MISKILLFLVVGITPMIVLFCIALYVKFIIVRRGGEEQKNEKDLYVTKKIAEKILLNNKWGSVDDKIAILRNNSIILNFRLGIHDEEKDI